MAAAAPPVTLKTKASGCSRCRGCGNRGMTIAGESVIDAGFGPCAISCECVKCIDAVNPSATSLSTSGVSLRGLAKFVVLLPANVWSSPPVPCVERGMPMSWYGQPSLP